MHVAAVHDNLGAIEHRLALLMARFPWVQMVLFSELAPYGPLPTYAQPLPCPAEDGFCELAARYGVWLVPGTLFEQDGEAIYNTAPVIDPAGTVVARYRKMFPFAPYEHGVTGGDGFCVFDVPGVGRFGLSICYDIWFPETTRTLTSMGAEVLLHPVLTGTIDRDVELPIARATAAMFQCYVFDINGLGAGGVGRSCVIDPTGCVLYQAGGHEELIPIEIDLEQVRRQRETGIRGLGQTLKSFRDRPVDFPVYDRASGAGAYLHTLGPLAMPDRGARGGIGGPAPAEVLGTPFASSSEAAPDDPETAATPGRETALPF